MKGWRFVRSWRWTGYLAFVVIFAMACVLLAQWQLARRAEAVYANDKVIANYDSSPASLDSTLPGLDSFDDSQEWRQVLLEGSYLADEQLLVRTRPFQGSPGFEVLVPFKVAGGNLFIVDRGWVPVGSKQDAPDSIPAPPSGETHVVVRLKPSESRVPGRSAPPGQVATIELSDIQKILDKPTYTGAYGLMVSEVPGTADRPKPFPKPVIDEGPHLSYAFQWIVFGVLAFIALAWAVRQEYRLINADDPAERRRAKERERRVRARGPSDADIEDAIVDQLSQSQTR
ncbi:MAG: SURF1 family protein [Terrimesophilobacter sp.]